MYWISIVPKAIQFIWYIKVNKRLAGLDKITGAAYM